jgi:hypothetical protein
MLKISGNYLIYRGSFKGAKVLSGRLIFSVGGEVK